MKKLMIGAALVTLVSGSAFAQSLAPAPGTGESLANSRGGVRSSHHAHYRDRHGGSSAFGAVTSFGSPLRERDVAIRDCSAAAAKTYPIRDSNWSILLYRACMTEHGQPE